MRESKFKSGVILRVLGLCCSIIPPALAILFYFPVWVERGGEYALSGFAALLMLAAFVPLFKLIKRSFFGLSSYMLWLIVFVVFFLVSRIADEMVVISFVGFIGNLVGAMLLKLGERCRK